MIGKEKILKFPRAIIILIIFEYFVRCSYNTITAVTALYLVDTLGYKDDEATVWFHVMVVVLLSSAVVGGIVADSFLGKFKTVAYFAVILTTGVAALAASSTPPLHLPLKEFTIAGMSLWAFGYGAVRPVLLAFGGNQFTLPQQQKQLTLFFMLISITENTASVSISLIVPVLRKDITCFGQLTCYPLVFIIPSVLMALAIGGQHKEILLYMNSQLSNEKLYFIIVLLLLSVMFLAMTRFYKIDKPEGNIIVRIIRCTCHAICQRFKAKEKQQHWLDYAKDQYELQLIEDIKSMTSVLKLMLPLITFWVVHSSQLTYGIFQASRMDGEVGGYVIKPDQIKLVNPVSVIIFAALFHPYVSPFLAKFFAINTPLRRITLGCFIAASAYAVSGIVELNLEPTYAKVPTEGLAQMRVYNTLNCKVPMAIDQQSYVINELDVFQKIDIATTGKRVLKYEIDLSNCDLSKITSKRFSGQLEVTEKQATSWGLTYRGLDYKFIDRVDKSGSGNPLVRTLIDVNDDFTENDISVALRSKGETLEKFKLPHKFVESEFKEVAHKIYDVHLNGRSVESNVPIKVGGVYTILGHISNSSLNIHTVTVTEPNSLSIFWVMPQMIILSVSEVMVHILIMDFAYSQAPKSMKCCLLAFWLFMGLFGNVIIVAITEAHLFERKLYLFFSYACAMTISAIIFAILAKFYTYKKPSEDNVK